MTQTGLQRAGSGGRSYTADGLEYDPGVSGTVGTAVTRTGFCPVKTNTLWQKMARAKASVQANSRLSARTNVPQIETNEGVLTLFVNAALGLNYLKALLGGKSSLSAVNATAVGAVVTTGTAATGGTSDIPATGAFVVGAPLWVNTGANQEATVILGYAAGHITVPALTINATTNNVVVQQPACDKYANSLLASGYEDDLPRLTVERAIRGKWGRLFPSVLVEKADWNFAKGLAEVAYSLYGTGQSTDLAGGGLTGYNPNSTDEATALSPFTSLNGIIAVGDDPSGSGTSSVLGAIGIKDAKISFDNMLLKDQVIGNPVMQAWPGDDVKLDISYNVIDTMQRSSVYEDYIKPDKGSAFHFGFAKNYGSKTVPDNKLVTMYTPFAKYEDSALTDENGKLGEFARKATGMYQRGSAADLLQVFVCNA